MHVKPVATYAIRAPVTAAVVMPSGALVDVSEHDGGGGNNVNARAALGSADAAVGTGPATALDDHMDLGGLAEADATKRKPGRPSHKGAAGDAAAAAAASSHTKHGYCAVCLMHVPDALASRRGEGMQVSAAAASGAAGPAADGVAARAANADTASLPSASDAGANSASAELHVLLACEGGCHQSFHPICLGMNLEQLRQVRSGEAAAVEPGVAASVTKPAAWRCPDCTRGHDHPCALCGQRGDKAYIPWRIWGYGDGLDSCGAPEFLMNLKDSGLLPAQPPPLGAAAASAGARVTSTTSGVSSNRSTNAVGGGAASGKKPKKSVTYLTALINGKLIRYPTDLSKSARRKWRDLVVAGSSYDDAYNAAKAVSGRRKDGTVYKIKTGGSSSSSTTAVAGGSDPSAHAMSTALAESQQDSDTDGDGTDADDGAENGANDGIDAMLSNSRATAAPGTASAQRSRTRLSAASGSRTAPSLLVESIDDDEPTLQTQPARSSSSAAAASAVVVETNHNSSPVSDIILSSEPGASTASSSAATSSSAPASSSVVLPEPTSDAQSVPASVVADAPTPVQLVKAALIAAGALVPAVLDSIADVDDASAVEFSTGAASVSHVSLKSGTKRSRAVLALQDHLGAGAAEEPDAAIATKRSRRSSAVGSAAAGGDVGSASGAMEAADGHNHHHHDSTNSNFVDEPPPLPYVPPLVAGAPSHLVGLPFSGVRPCCAKRCGKFYHYACLRRLSDVAVMDRHIRSAKLHNAQQPVFVPVTTPIAPPDALCCNPLPTEPPTGPGADSAAGSKPKRSVSTVARSAAASTSESASSTAAAEAVDVASESAPAIAHQAALDAAAHGDGRPDAAAIAMDTSPIGPVLAAVVEVPQGAQVDAAPSEGDAAGAVMEVDAAVDANAGSDVNGNIGGGAGSQPCAQDAVVAPADHIHEEEAGDGNDDDDTVSDDGDAVVDLAGIDANDHEALAAAAAAAWAVKLKASAEARERWLKEEAERDEAMQAEMVEELQRIADEEAAAAADADGARATAGKEAAEAAAAAKKRKRIAPDWLQSSSRDNSSGGPLQLYQPLPNLPAGHRSVDPQGVEPLVGMEPIWLAPGVTSDFICPRHLCDTCEQGTFGAAAAVSSDEYILGSALEWARRGVAMERVGIGLPQRMRQMVEQAIAAGFAGFPAPPPLAITAAASSAVPTSSAAATSSDTSVTVHQQQPQSQSSTNPGNPGITAVAQPPWWPVAHLLRSTTSASSSSAAQSTSKLPPAHEPSIAAIPADGNLLHGRSYDSAHVLRVSKLNAGGSGTDGSLTERFVQAWLASPRQPLKGDDADSNEWVVVSTDRLGIVQRLLSKRTKPEVCVVCPRMYHEKVAYDAKYAGTCLPPGHVWNDGGVFLCPVHAGVDLSTVDRDVSGITAFEASAGTLGNAYGSETGGAGNEAVEMGEDGQTRLPKWFLSMDALKLASVARSVQSKLSNATVPEKPSNLDPEDHRHYRTSEDIFDDVEHISAQRASWVEQRNSNKPPPFQVIQRNRYVIKVKPDLPETEVCNCAAVARANGIPLDGSKGPICGDDCVNRLLNVECYGGHDYALPAAASASAASSSASASSTSSLGAGAGAAPSPRPVAASASSSSLSGRRSSRGRSIVPSAGDVDGSIDDDSEVGADTGAGAAPSRGVSKGRSRRTNCSVGPHCGNRALQLRQLPVLNVVQTHGKGWGVIAGCDIDAGAFIIEYVGEIISDEMQDERLAAARARGEHDAYMMEIDADQIIDARFKANIARFVNHSCDPNAELQRWHVEGYTRIGIFALKDIKTGQEVAYDYQFFTAEVGNVGWSCTAEFGVCRASTSRISMQHMYHAWSCSPIDGNSSH